MAAGAPAEPDEPLMPVFIPALVVVLTALERQKGAPLTEADVLVARDRGVCMTMRRSHAEAFQAGRGGDLDPENAWADWQAFQTAQAS